MKHEGGPAVTMTGSPGTTAAACAGAPRSPRPADGHAAAAVLLGRVRDAATRWAARPIEERVALIRRTRERLAERGLELAAEVARRPAAETLAAEVLPMLDAARYLEREARHLLAPQRRGSAAYRAWAALSRSGAPVEVRREPYGVVLIIGPSNYPLMLPAVQLLQALAAGNAVIVKPGRGGAAALNAVAATLLDAGLPRHVLTVTDESIDTGNALLRAGVDKVVFTGSAGAGRELLARAARSTTPATLELSGWDAAFVREDADLELTVRALRFGATFNGGANCIAPRRVLVAESRAAALEHALGAALGNSPAIELDAETARRAETLLGEALAQGARLVCGGVARGAEAGRRVVSFAPTLLADVPGRARIAREEVFAPVLMLMPVRDDDDALRRDLDCPYSLGAAVFGRDRGAARRLAERIDAGLVIVNDAVAPLADPRVPLCARGASGFGATRGAEGLLAMTRPKAIVAGRGSRPHLAARPPSAALLAALVEARHGRGAARRWRAAARLLRALVASRGERG